MRSLRSGVATAALVAMWSSAAFGFNLFGSDKPEKPKPPAQAQTQPQQKTDDEAETPTLAKTLAANLDMEIEKAKTQRALGDNTGAAHALAQIMLVAPDDVRVVSEYGKVLVSLGRSDDAVAFLKRALQLSPNDWTLYSAIGAAFDQKADFESARTAYQRGLELKPGGAALLNNYAMSRMLAGDLPGAQALIAQAQAAGNDPKIAHNAALMTNLRGPRAETAHPVVASTVPAAQTPSAKPAAVAPKPTAALAPKPVAALAPKPVASFEAAPVAHTLPKPVATAVLPPPAQIKPEFAKPEPVKTATVPAAPKAAPVKDAVIAKPEPVKTASTAPSEKPTIIKTQTGRVMMQAVPKDSEAGPVKNADPVKTETASADTASTDAATSAPRTLASAAPSPRVTPDLRAASD